jgi:hypothetical protein
VVLMKPEIGFVKKDESPTFSSSRKLGSIQSGFKVSSMKHLHQSPLKRLLEIHINLILLSPGEWALITPLC